MLLQNARLTQPQDMMGRIRTSNVRLSTPWEDGPLNACLQKKRLQWYTLHAPGEMLAAARISKGVAKAMMPAGMKACKAAPPSLPESDDLSDMPVKDAR